MFTNEKKRRGRTVDSMTPSTSWPINLPTLPLPAPEMTCYDDDHHDYILTTECAICFYVLWVLSSLRIPRREDQNWRMVIQVPALPYRLPVHFAVLIFNSVLNVLKDTIHHIPQNYASDNFGQYRGSFPIVFKRGVTFPVVTLSRLFHVLLLRNQMSRLHSSKFNEH